jgi:CheY-like chemotaxis protein
MYSVKPYILMIEDDEDDRYLTQSTLDELKVNIPIRFLKRSDEIIPFIEENGEPSLILLDYNCTPVNSIDILKLMKQHLQYGYIPVVVLSENTAEELVKEFYRAGASSFISKPTSIDATRNKIQTFFKYWLEVAEV